MSRWAIGIDLGGTAIKAAVVGEERGILTDRRVLTDTSSGPAGIVGQLVALIAEGSAELSAESSRLDNFSPP
jgi:glucokinase